MLKLKELRLFLRHHIILKALIISVIIGTVFFAVGPCKYHMSPSRYYSMQRIRIEDPAYYKYGVANNRIPRAYWGCYKIPNNVYVNVRAHHIKYESNDTDKFLVVHTVRYQTAKYKNNYMRLLVIYGLRYNSLYKAYHKDPHFYPSTNAYPGDYLDKRVDGISIPISHKYSKPLK